MIWIAFTMGLVGSLHCLGMCGPIALSIPVADPSPLKRFFMVFLYNLGRVLVYSAFGLAAGAIGESMAMAGYQQALSVTAGIVILLLLFTPISGKISGAWGMSRMKNMFASLMKKRSAAAVFMLGVLNGFLPCGMVYIALAGAAGTGDVINGATFMAAFGAGTFPMMASVTYLASMFTIRFRSVIRQMFPFAMGVMALLLIIRGMNLDIPYLSPVASSESKVHACCHKPAGESKK